jgi:DNA-3-methyladenine glycosylase
LLGHLLIRNSPEGPFGGVIVETEAYLVDDPACHSYAGRTLRNRSMWGPPGRAYVYFIYGNHCCVNAVCQLEGVAEAVLIRAVEPTIGIERMQQNRPARRTHELTNGPGKLCQAMRIDRSLDGVNLCDPEGPLFIANNTEHKLLRATLGPLVTTERIGITKAADLPLRFLLSGSSCISRNPGKLRMLAGR